MIGQVFPLVIQRLWPLAQVATGTVVAEHWCRSRGPRICAMSTTPAAERFEEAHEEDEEQPRAQGSQKVGNRPSPPKAKTHGPEKTHGQLLEGSSRFHEKSM